MATATATSVHIQCRDAIADLVAAQSATIPPAARVYKLWHRDVKTVQLPCVFVTIERLREQRRRASFEIDEITYPVAVALAFREDMDYPNRADEYLEYRRALMRLLDARRLPGVDATFGTEIEPELAMDFDPRAYQYAVSGFTVQCDTTEPRRSDYGSR